MDPVQGARQVFDRGYYTMNAPGKTTDFADSTDRELPAVRVSFFGPKSCATAQGGFQQRGAGRLTLKQQMGRSGIRPLPAWEEADTGGQVLCPRACATAEEGFP